MSVIPQGITHLEVTGSGANFWRIPHPEQSDGTGDFWLDGQWVTSEISGNFVDRLVSVSGTPAHRWSADPHAGRYDGERADLAMGDLTDDELANGAFMNYDRPLNIEGILAGTHSSPIAWMTAVKDRIRWLSRKLDESLMHAEFERQCKRRLEDELVGVKQALAVWDRPEPWGANDIIPLGVGSITGEAYRRGVEAGRRTPVKVVADISGGALYGVYAEVPVRVLFISDDADDVSAMEENLGEDGLHRDPNGKPIASWYLASNGGADAEMVQHYFEQE